MSTDGSGDDPGRTEEESNVEADRGRSASSRTTTARSEGRTARPMSRTVLLVAGVLVGLLGLVAIFSPYVAGVAISYALGFVLLAGAVVHVFSAFSGRGWKGFLLQVLLAVVYGIAGVALLTQPIVGLLTLTALLVAYLFVEGVVEIVLGFRLRPTGNWGWMVVSGVLSVVLAVLLFAGFPATAAWALGLLVGLSLLSTGISLVLLGLAGGAEPSAALGRPAGGGGTRPD